MNIDCSHSVVVSAEVNRSMVRCVACRHFWPSLYDWAQAVAYKPTPRDEVDAFLDSLDWGHLK